MGHCEGHQLLLEADVIIGRGELSKSAYTNVYNNAQTLSCEQPYSGGCCRGHHIFLRPTHCWSVHWSDWAFQNQRFKRRRLGFLFFEGQSRRRLDWVVKCIQLRRRVFRHHNDRSRLHSHANNVFHRSMVSLQCLSITSHHSKLCPLRLLACLNWFGLASRKQWMEMNFNGEHLLKSVPTRPGKFSRFHRLLELFTAWLHACPSLYNQHSSLPTKLWPRGRCSHIRPVNASKERPSSPQSEGNEEFLLISD